MITVKRGLDLPITGEPRQEIEAAQRVGRVALVGDDYVGVKPTFHVAVGDSVRCGQLLFTDKRRPAIRFTAPASGRVAEINRGTKRVFQSIVIEVQGDQQEPFTRHAATQLAHLDRAAVRDNLLQSGLWTVLRKRPFSTIPDPESSPHALFVTAMDTQPLAARPEVVLADLGDEFRWGLQVLRQLTDGNVFLCKEAGVAIPGTDLDGITVAEFSGPHPAGLPGTHIHFLSPVNERRVAWHVGYQDVAAIGRLFVTGQISVDRVVSLAGPAVQQPRLVRTRIGANLAELMHGELAAGDSRVISGSVLSGRAATGVLQYLGRYHLQVSALFEGTQRKFLGWQTAGFDKFSVKRVFASSIFGRSRRFAFTTSLEGSPRAMVPVGAYERVMPLDLLPTFLLRSLIIGDTEQSRLLGCLELDEEDLALCTYVCPSKYEYGPLLRKALAEIEKEG